MTFSVQPTPPPANRSISRRRFLRFGALAAAVSCVPCPALALERTAQKFERSLDFYNVQHRGKSTHGLLDQGEISPLVVARY